MPCTTPWHRTTADQSEQRRVSRGGSGGLCQHVGLQDEWLHNTLQGLQSRLQGLQLPGQQ